MDKNLSKRDVLKITEENDVKFIRLYFTDITGQMKGFSITKEELEGALEEGMGFDGSSIKGFARIDESDMIAMPDPDTFTILPYRPQERAVGAMICDILNPDGSPYEGDSRYIFRRQLEKIKKQGYSIL